MTLPQALFQYKQKPFKAMILEFITLPEYKNIEIEARIGRITNKITKKRINFKIDHPILFDSLPNELCFESGVEEKDFQKIKNLIAGQSPFICTSDKITVSNKFRRMESLTDANVISFQRKDKIKSMDIFLPYFKYDIRISISTETVAQPKDFDHKRIQISRLRKRESLQIGPFVFDFTKISNNKEKDMKKCEIELEIKDCDEGIVDFANIVFSLPLLKMEIDNRLNVRKR